MDEIIIKLADYGYVMRDGSNIKFLTYKSIQAVHSIVGADYYVIDAKLDGDRESARFVYTIRKLN